MHWHARGRFAHFLHRRQQQADQDGDDGDHHEQFDQRKTLSQSFSFHDGGSWGGWLYNNVIRSIKTEGSRRQGVLEKSLTPESRVMYEPG